jgi:hypothetical protein
MLSSHLVRCFLLDANEAGMQTAAYPHLLTALSTAPWPDDQAPAAPASAAGAPASGSAAAAAAPPATSAAKRSAVPQLACAQALLAHVCACARDALPFKPGCPGHVEPSTVASGLARLLHQRAYQPVRLSSEEQAKVALAASQGGVEAMVPVVRHTVTALCATIRPET